jgi:hypothetical protein
MAEFAFEFTGSGDGIVALTLKPSPTQCPKPGVGLYKLNSVDP